MVVTSRFHDIDLAAGGPRSVGVFDGHHPDGGPQPITFRDLGLDLDTSVLDRCAELGVQPSRLYWRDDWIMLTIRKKTNTETLTGSIGDVGDSNTIGPSSSGTPSFGEINNRVGGDQRFILESWLDVELSIFDEGILISACGFLELLVATTVVSWRFQLNKLLTYPNPPTVTSFVQIDGLSVPVEKSSSSTGQ
jgi:hypothetical protein